jgi:uncharacterized LabA/DUF88 family protein
MNIHINNFEDLMFALLNPFFGWKRNKNTLYIKNKFINYELNYKSNFNDLILKSNNKNYIFFNKQELYFVWRAISFLLGSIPEHIKDFNIKEVSVKRYYPEGGRKKIQLIPKEKILTIISKNSNNKSFENPYFIKKQECIFEYEPLGTIGDLFKNKIEYDKISYSHDLERDEKPFFKLKNKNIKINDNKIIESLALWDYENVNFFDDFSTITKMLKKDNQLKIVSFNRKHKSTELKYFNSLDFKLNKMKKRDWIINTTKGIADDELINSFNKYKNNLKELILISGDSDFKNIIYEALELGISVKIINNSNHNISWFKNIDFEKFSYLNIN